MPPARASKATIPDKLYFKIGEVAKIVGVEPYVLRYWETEFAVLKPSKSRSQHRRYRRRDIETLIEIKRLLHDERFTIEGARKRLKTASKGGRRVPAKQVAAPAEQQIPLPLSERRYRSLLGRVKRDIEALHKMLS